LKNSLEKAKEIRQSIKKEWDDLWISRHEDKLIAEGVSIKDFNLLFVEKGEIIHAVRDYKLLSFPEILEKHIGKEDTNKIDIDPNIGGYKKFSKQHFTNKKKNVKRSKPKVRYDVNQHLRKGGAGWRNKARLFKKVKEALDD
jgi:hypothetical protein